MNQTRFDDIAVLGISGGGWYTVWLAALIPELQVSLSYAGSLPMAYRLYPEIQRDWEGLSSPIYKIVSYLDLYQLMLLDRIGRPNREAYLIYNDNDPCCFSNPAAADFKRKVKDLNFYPMVLIESSFLHEMDVSLVTQLLKDL